MISIDKLSYISELRKINPMEKFIFSMFTMIVCICLNNIIVSIITLLLMSAITICIGKLSVKTYWKLILLPMTFLIIGIITIAINIVQSNSELLFSFNIFNLKLGTSVDSLVTALRIFFKALASVSCLYFLTLSTPVFEILAVLKKLKMPKLFIELMSLIYRFIFVLLDTANMIFISQCSRLGYSTIKLSYNSLGQLITSLFIRSYKRSQDVYIAMESRGYEGEINLLENNYKFSSKNIVIIIFLEIFLIAIGIGKIF
ncbi:cobalt ECF transporter T component CbiQ [Candidatus Clostridium radicumherbarum]|uniref:Cobalt ECF transporter T component CbiQ n=1 Tax=Candidatus Clostridium radicumherbarum TaxID=3381662 RepID=A0ABW8TTU3_9CLOT